MEYKLIKMDNEYYLVLATGEIKVLTVKQVRSLILNFDSFEIDESMLLVAAPNFDVSMGEYLASVNNDHTLTFYNSSLLNDIFFDESAYIGVQEYAEMHGKKRAIVSRLCNDGRISGAIRKGTKWYIPKNAPYPKDCRAGRDMSKRYAHKKENNA